MATAAASLALVACTDLPDRIGPLAACVPTDARAYRSAREGGGAWRMVDLRNGGFHSLSARQDRQHCWPRVRGMNSPNRRCVQRNDLFVEMRTDDAVTHYRIPARTTYMIYGESGQAQCRVVMKEQ